MKGCYSPARGGGDDDKSPADRSPRGPRALRRDDQPPESRAPLLLHPGRPAPQDRDGHPAEPRQAAEEVGLDAHARSPRLRQLGTVRLDVRLDLGTQAFRDEDRSVEDTPEL